MFEWIHRIFAGRRAPVALVRAQTIPPTAAAQSQAIRYPPSDPGIQLDPIEQVIESQRPLISRIYRTLGATPDQFAERVNPAVANLARQVHLLPATASDHHCGPGALFRLCLEMALFSLQAANSAEFPMVGGSERRYALQPKWILATMFAGMCSQLHRSLTSMTVLGANGVRWQPLLVPLYDWALAEGLDRYFVRWLSASDPDGAQATSAFLVAAVCPAEVVQWLAEDNAEVIPAMTAAIAGAPPQANPIARLIVPLLPRLIERDLANAAQHYGRFSVGFQLEPHLIDAMRRLVRGDVWECNGPGAALWIGAEGAFIDWELVCGQVVELVARDNLAGVPRDPESLARILIDAGVFVRPARQGALYWTLDPPELAQPIVGCVRLGSPKLILGEDFDAAPYADVRLTSVGQAPELARFPVAAEEPPAVTTPPESTPAAPAKARKQLDHEPLDNGPPEPPPLGELPAPATQSAEALLGILDAEQAWLLRQIIARAQSGDLAGPVLVMPQGIAIAMDEISSHGHPAPPFIQAMKKAGWLWKDVTHPMRSTHPLEYGGRSAKFVIMRREIGEALGLEAVAGPAEEGE